MNVLIPNPTQPCFIHSPLYLILLNFSNHQPCQSHREFVFSKWASDWITHCRDFHIDIFHLEIGIFILLTWPFWNWECISSADELYSILMLISLYIPLSKTNSRDPSLGRVINNAAINIGKEVSVRAFVFIPVGWVWRNKTLDYAYQTADHLSKQPCHYTCLE